LPGGVGLRKFAAWATLRAQPGTPFYGCYMDKLDRLLFGRNLSNSGLRAWPKAPRLLSMAGTFRLCSLDNSHNGFGPWLSIASQSGRVAWSGFSAARGSARSARE